MLGSRFREGGYVVTVDTLAGPVEVMARRRPPSGEAVRLTADPDGIVVVRSGE